MKLMDYGRQAIDFRHPPTVEPAAGFSRRGFVMGSLASGFALASQPVLAQAISTDSQGLVVTELKLAVADGTAWMAFFCSTMMAMALELLACLVEKGIL